MHCWLCGKPFANGEWRQLLKGQLIPLSVFLKHIWLCEYLSPSQEFKQKGWNFTKICICFCSLASHHSWRIFVFLGEKASHIWLLVGDVLLLLSVCTVLWLEEDNWKMLMLKWYLLHNHCHTLIVKTCQFALGFKPCHCYINRSEGWFKVFCLLLIILIASFTDSNCYSLWVLPTYEVPYQVFVGLSFVLFLRLALQGCTHLTT